jgi:hypothetical protein
MKYKRPATERYRKYGFQKERRENGGVATRGKKKAEWEAGEKERT